MSADPRDSQEDDIPGTIPKTVLPGVPDWVCIQHGNQGALG